MLLTMHIVKVTSRGCDRMFKLMVIWHKKQKDIQRHIPHTTEGSVKSDQATRTGSKYFKELRDTDYLGSLAGKQWSRGGLSESLGSS
jgi:hypothetical protein